MSDIETLAPGVTEERHLGVSIVYSGIEHGNVGLRFGEPEEVAANRARLVQSLSPVRYVIQRPVPGGDFLDLSDIPTEELEDEYYTDGLFINRPNVALGVNPADCVAMAIYGRDSQGLGVIHIGRQGVDGGIHETSVRHLIEAYEVALDDVRAYFGPAISQDSYFYPKISAEQLADPKWNKFIDRRGGNYHIDLVGRIVKDMTELGVEPVNISVHPHDTGSDSRYFSHARSLRTGEPEGRNGFAAMLREDAI
ncbi:MAG TPA: polyphenol oxidase family protein [Candidatus Saccharimonadales bacterium]|nr:polyphenol oxidase family protein [Candidatus Saccharimonadales bacterium]